jgi:hypothetical protein
MPNNKSNPTSGPWIVFEGKGNFYVEAPGSNPSSRVMVCTIHETSVSIEQATRAEHDAKLIAAAPDLFEVAQMVASSIKVEEMSLISAARAAIKKATGGDK